MKVYPTANIKIEEFVHLQTVKCKGFAYLKNFIMIKLWSIIVCLFTNFRRLKVCTLANIKRLKVFDSISLIKK